MLEARKTVTPAGRVQVVGDKSGVVMCVIRFQKLDCWESDRRSQEDGRKRDEVDCNAKYKAMQFKDLSLRKWKDQLTAGTCLFRVIDRGKSEARHPSSRNQGHLQVCPDRACMERATKDRVSSISVDWFSKD